MSPGKLAAQVAHCAEAYWTNQIRQGTMIQEDRCLCEFEVSQEIYDGYIKDRFVKTICEARNKTHLLKAKDIAEKLGLKEKQDYGMIYDACFTELTPEEEDGTTLTGIWFRPLPDETAHLISMKFQLYR